MRVTRGHTLALWLGLAALACVGSLATGCSSVGSGDEPSSPAGDDDGEDDHDLDEDGDGDDDADPGDGDAPEPPPDPGFPTACTPPEPLTDLSQFGSYAVGVTSYDAGNIVFDLPGTGDLQLAVPVRGELFYPAEREERAALPRADGKYPLVLVLHGNHPIYRDGDGDTVACKDTLITGSAPRMKTLEEIREERGDGSQVIPSHLGMTYLARNLAAAGYVVSLIDGNGANCVNMNDGFIGERARLMQKHLEVLRDAADGKDPVLAKVHGTLDLERVIYAGHSRGAEAAITAALTTVSGATVRGALAVAPTNFLFESANLVVPVPMLVVLPAADGDVSFNGGMRYFDVAQPPEAPTTRWFKAQQYVHGANHNFFNSEWTQTIQDCGTKEDGDNGQGNGEQRLTRAAQESYFTAITRTFLAAVLDDHGGARSVLAGMRTIEGQGDVLAVAAYAESTRMVSLPARPESSGFSTLASYPFTQNANAYNRTFFHATDGYVAVWSEDDPRFTLTVDEPGEQPAYVAFRVAQVAGDENNAQLRPRVLDVQLEDTRGRVVNASSDWNGAPIPLWYERPPWLDSDENCAPVPAEKTVLGTVMVPISCFTGDAEIALDSLHELHFELGAGPGALAITDVQLIPAL